MQAANWIVGFCSFNWAKTLLIDRIWLGSARLRSSGGRISESPPGESGSENEAGFSLTSRWLADLLARLLGRRSDRPTDRPTVRPPVTTRLPLLSCLLLSLCLSVALLRHLAGTTRASRLSGQTSSSSSSSFTPAECRSTSGCRRQANTHKRCR